MARTLTDGRMTIPHERPHASLTPFEKKEMPMRRLIPAAAVLLALMAVGAAPTASNASAAHGVSVPAAHGVVVPAAHGV